MTALEKLKASNAWDARYDLPTCPNHNNPWLYMAYADVVLMQAKELPLDVFKIMDQFGKCEIGFKSGLFHRWPTGDGGTTSHDEIVGAAFLNQGIAQDILKYLDENDGYFDNKAPNETNPIKRERFNVYRFYWLRPYLVACARPYVGLISQIEWSIGLIFDSFNEGNHNMWYLMSLMMYKKPLARIAIEIWRVQMRARGITFKSELAKEPKENPILSELAINDYIF